VRGFLITALAVLACGCAGAALDKAVASANTARDILAEAGNALHAVCTERYQEAKTKEAIARLDAHCVPARDALAAYRTAWLALVAAIDLAKSQGHPDDPRLIPLGIELAEAAERLATALGGAQ
jgi:hypothetical protein